jgi:hypothetical protein
MTFKTTLKRALERADNVIVVGGGVDSGTVEHQFHGEDTVILEGEGDDGYEYQFGEFLLAQEIEVDDSGTAAVVTIPDETGETVTFLVTFEQTAPLSEE